MAQIYVNGIQVQVEDGDEVTVPATATIEETVEKPTIFARAKKWVSNHKLATVAGAGAAYLIGKKILTPEEPEEEEPEEDDSEEESEE